MNHLADLATALCFSGGVIAAVVLADRTLVDWIARRRSSEVGVRIGVTPSRRLLALTLAELQQGVLIGGSPGAGKTTLLRTLVSRLPVEIGVVIVDLKGDRSLGPRLGIGADSTFGLGSRCAAAWNPIHHGSPASWRDILMAAEEWSEPHYRQAAARYLGAALSAFASIGRELDLGAAIALLENPKAAHGLLRDLAGRERDVLKRAVDVIEADKSLRSGVLGLGNRLALLVDSPATKGRFGASGGIDLDDALRGGRLLFSLPAGEFPEEAPAIAATVIQTLGAAGQRHARGDEELKVLLVVDEAPRLLGGQLREAVAIGRGAGVGTVVAVQDFADLDYVSPGTRESVETGANTWVVMRQASSAGDIAASIGSESTVRETIQRDEARLLGRDTGMRSLREVEEFRVSPNAIRRLGRGEAIVWRRLRDQVEEIKVDPR